MANSALILSTPVVSADNTLLIDRDDDALLVGDGGGVLGDHELAYAGSYAAQANPFVNGAAIKNVANDGHCAVTVGDATMQVVAGQTLGYLGGGMDFGSLTVVGSGLQESASINAAIFASTNQYCQLWHWIKLPTEANWTTQSTLLPFKSSNSSASATGSPNLVNIGARLSGSNKQIIAQRKLTSSTLETTVGVTIPAGSPAFGAVCLVDWYRLGQQKFTLYYPGGVLSATQATGPSNTEDFSAAVPYFGVGPTNWTASILATSGAGKWRGYRSVTRRLDLDTRNPDTMAAAEWATISPLNIFT